VAQRARALRGEFQAVAEGVVGEADGTGLSDTRHLVRSQLQSVYRSLQTSWDTPTQSQQRNLGAAEAALRDALTAFRNLVSGEWTALRRDTAAAGASVLEDLAPLDLNWSPSGG
jgi:hypothetical protein